jgi:predicted permease
MIIHNHLKVALRNLWKNRGFSAINIAGLAMGLACSLLIFLWISDEKGIDAFHKERARLYQVYERQYFDGKVSGQFYTPAPLAEELKKQIPEIEMACSYGWPEPHNFSVGNKVIKQSGTAAGKDYFAMFSYPLVAGTAADALSTPESITVSRSMAISLFGSVEAALNKTIRYEGKRDFIIKAVFEDITSQSSSQFDYLFNWEAFYQMNSWLKEWDNHAPYTYVMLRNDADTAAVDRKIRGFIEKFDNATANGYHVEIGLKLFKDVYLNSHFENGVTVGGRSEYVRLFSLVAVFILVIACINFMNLTTARSIKRAKEIGVRKVVGAGRGRIISQFLGEAVLIALFAALLSLLIVLLVLPLFNHITGKQMLLPFGNPAFWCMILVLTLATGLLSGSYPALFLSGFNPVRILKGGTLKAGPAALWLRKSLVVFQFVLSIVLIISTILIARQVNYVQEINLGYDRENLLYIPLDNQQVADNVPVFITEASRIKGVVKIAEVSQSPTDVQNGTLGVRWKGKDPKSKIQFAQLAIGYDYLETMKLQLAEGRGFSRDFADSNSYILNEAAAKKIGFKKPVGEALTFWGKEGQVVGVLKDFHFQSLHENIRPIIFRLAEGRDPGMLVVRVAPQHTAAVLKQMQAVWHGINPMVPFAYQFSSEEYNRMYKSEQVVKSLSEVFAGLAIVISCLGLLGLSMFTAEQRVKEFGVRKVLGAGFITLCSLLSVNFLVLVGIAFAIAAPLAYWAMHVWLRNYAYHTNISWTIFAVAGVTAILVAQITIFFQAVKVARANPLKSLKAE